MEIGDQRVDRLELGGWVDEDVRFRLHRSGGGEATVRCLSDPPHRIFNRAHRGGADRDARAGRGLL